MFLIALLCLYSPLFVADPKHSIKKFQKYLELINTARTIVYQPASNTKVCNKATESHIPPLDVSPEYKWQDFDISSQNLQFNETQKDWFAFTGELNLPSIYNKDEHLVRFTFEINNNWLVNADDDDFPAGPEGRYWINGIPIGAYDSYHHGNMLDWNELGGEKKVAQMRIFTGRARASHSLSKFGISLVHRDTEAFYQRLRFLIDILNQLSDDNPDKHGLKKAVDKAVRLLDIRELHYPIDLVDIRIQGSNFDAFHKSTKAALKCLKDEVAALPRADEAYNPSISVVGYSHIDTMWQWTFNTTHFKTTNTATSMLYLMEHPPHDFENPVEWKFLATAPQHYKWMQEDAPELFKRVVEKAKNGQWDINGLMWLEPDTTLPSGEGLARQILYGVRYFAKNCGEEFKQTVLFLPDCFGFTGSLPGILRAAEVDSFVTSKISWSEYNDFPYSTFQWRGIDNSIVNCHFISTPTGSGHATTYTGTSTAQQLIGTWKNNKQNKILHTSALHTSGNGDGGGGITEEMIWNYNIYNELPQIQDVPRLKFRTIDQVLEEVREKSHDLPVWDDELYLEYHRGTLTSFEEIKRQNRQLEQHLHNVEWLMTVYNTLTNEDVSSYKSAIEPIWEDALLFHFHDCIPGSSINEGNLDAIRRGRPDLAKLRELENELAEKIASLIKPYENEGTDQEIIFNTLAHPRYVDDQYIPSGGWAPKEKTTKIIYDSDETTMFERVNDNDYSIYTINEPFIQTSIPHNKESSKIVVDASTRTVTTPFFNVTFDEKGQIISIFDTGTNYEYISAPANVFELYEDRPLSFPAWDINLYHKEMPAQPPVFQGIEFHDDYVVTEYEIPRIGKGDGEAETTTIKQIITFSATEPFIDFRTLVNWTQHDKLLKVAFPTTVRARDARYGIQFGNILRPTHNSTDRDMAKFEVHGRWADLGEYERGVALMSDTKAGFDIHEQIIRLSLLKSSMTVDRWEDFGERKFTYRVVFHNDSYSDAHIQNIHDDLITPPVITQLEKKNMRRTDISLDNNMSFVDLSDRKVILDTLKIAEDEDGFIARFYESTGSMRRVTVTFNALESSKWSDAEIVTLVETPFGGKTETITKNAGDKLSFTFTLKSFQILSLLIKRNK
ncbi:glycosyl hydrolase [Tritrichomonas foetus]|uniref:alpha-mannosidase n=1 Tax=Tritrichomonas foetus TaxID=1144522 RepID=A0A1J4KCD3_9EUKA|nr:glycosyl hydrolase [Tritrichomonas foetus]|eukprot:OHT07117.1 glycosyl hydrolase [Tritrichomonas foetus]